MGKVNKRLSFRKSLPQKGTPKKNKLKEQTNQLSQQEKMFLLTNYSGSQSLKVVQKMFVEKFPKAKIPSFRLIYNLSKRSKNLHISIEDTSTEDIYSNNNTLSVIKTPETVTKRKSLQSIKNLKNKKGKRNKYKKLVNLRISQLLQRDSKINMRNTSNVAECLSFNSQNSISASPSTSSSSPHSSPRGIKNLKRRREEDAKHPTIFLDSPDPKPSVRYPVICEIDLTNSPGNNNNYFLKNISLPNGHPTAISTPFTYAHVAGLSNSPNVGTLSPINKKLRLSTHSTFIYERPEFLTVDQCTPGQSSLDKMNQNTVICLDNEETVLPAENEETVLPAENPPKNTLNLDAPNKEFVSKNNMSEISNEEFFLMRSIDLTDDLKENTPALPVPARQPIVYDLTLDISHDSYSTSSLVRKKEQILSALAQTVEDSSKKYTKTKSVTRTGSNIYFPANKNVERTGLRMVVIDGSNVAMSHRHGKSFSVEGLKQCIQYFLDKGHEVKAFVPRFRNRKFKSTNGRLLDQLEEKGHVVYTPSREIKGKLIMSYDDRYIVQCAVEYEGVIISNDNYRDLLRENEAWRDTIEQRLLPFTWVGDMIIFPQDPLGKNGPTLKQFLSHPDPTTKKKGKNK